MPPSSCQDHHIIFQKSFITMSKQNKTKKPWYDNLSPKKACFPGILLLFFSCLGGEALTAHTAGNNTVFSWSKVPLSFFKHHGCSTGCQSAPACWFQDWRVFGGFWKQIIAHIPFFHPFPVLHSQAFYSLWRSCQGTLGEPQAISLLCHHWYSSHLNLGSASWICYHTPRGLGGPMVSFWIPHSTSLCLLD